MLGTSPMPGCGWGRLLERDSSSIVDQARGTNVRALLITSYRLARSETGEPVYACLSVTRDWNVVAHVDGTPSRSWRTNHDFVIIVSMCGATGPHQLYPSAYA